MPAQAAAAKSALRSALRMILKLNLQYYQHRANKKEQRQVYLDLNKT
jgi:hypothetical protein